MMISCSSSSDDDEPAGEWQNWSTMNLCIALDQSNYETLKGVGRDIPVDFGSMRCYVDKQYYSITAFPVIRIGFSICKTVLSCSATRLCISSRKTVWHICLPTETSLST